MGLAEMYPLLNLVATKPGLLADHAEGYIELVSQELAQAADSYKRSAILATVGLLCFVVALALAGVALMLWATTPAANLQAPWILVCVPLTPTVAAIACWAMSRSRSSGGHFHHLQEQLKADLAVLRQMGTS